MKKFKNLLIGKPYDASTESIPVSDWDSLYEEYSDTHLRQSATDTVVGKIKNSVSLVKFHSKDKNLEYRFNTKANQNMNANEFKSKIIHDLIFEGEALVVIVNDNLYIADSWSVDKQALRENRYYEVVVGGLPLKMQFTESEVFHFKYHNEKFKKLLRQLDKSYATLFQRLIDIQMREQQVRIFAKFPGMTSKSEEEQAKFNKYLKGLEKKVKEDTVVVVPRQDDYDIEEQKQSYLGRSVSEVQTLENMYITQVANALQVPPLIFSGELADVSQHNENYIRDCIRPLVDIIATEVNAKYFKMPELEDKQLKANTIQLIYNSEFAMARDAEKMVGSGVWTIDDVLEQQGKPRLETELTTRRYLTKNISPLREDGTLEDSNTGGIQNEPPPGADE